MGQLAGRVDDRQTSVAGPKLAPFAYVALGAAASGVTRRGRASKPDPTPSLTVHPPKVPERAEPPPGPPAPAPPRRPPPRHCLRTLHARRLTRSHFEHLALLRSRDL